MVGDTALVVVSLVALAVTLAEDTDITMAVLRAGYTVVHEERARAWTEAPSTVTDLWRQRWRWGYGPVQRR